MNRIAVVEDNADNRLLIDAILGDTYDLTEYENGLDALEKIPDDVPDLILLDISLPGMDGTEVLKNLKKHPELSQVPTIALTAHAMSGDRERYLAAGFDEYVSKPIVDESLLTQIIERLLKKA